MRARVILLTIVIALASLVPVAAQTVPGCTVGMVTGLLQMTGACDRTIHVSGQPLQMSMPSHLVPPVVTAGVVAVTPIPRFPNAKENRKQKKQRMRQHARHDTQAARQDARKAERKAKITPTPTTTRTDA